MANEGEVGVGGVGFDAGVHSALGKRAAVVYVEHEGKILCVWNKRFGGWCLPGGKVEAGEEPREAAIRELAEETGLLAGDLKYLAAAPGTVEPGVEVFVYEELALREKAPQQREDGCPVAWLTREGLLYEGNPFASFYRKFFEGRPLRPRLVFGVGSSRLTCMASLSTIEGIVGEGKTNEVAMHDLAIKLGEEIIRGRRQAAEVAKANLRESYEPDWKVERRRLEGVVVKEVRAWAAGRSPETLVDSSTFGILSAAQKLELAEIPF